MTVLIHGLLTSTSEPSPARIGRNGSRWAAAFSPVWNIPSSSSTTSGMVPSWRAFWKFGSSGTESSETNA